MEINGIIDLFINQGIWALMFIVFYFDSNKKNNEREYKYQERESKYIETISQCGVREYEYQKIISDYNDKIIPTLEHIKEKL